MFDKTTIWQHGLYKKKCTKVQLYQKYSFKNHSYKCGSRELLVPLFVVTPRHNPNVFQTCYMTQDKVSNFLQHLSISKVWNIVLLIVMVFSTLLVCANKEAHYLPFEMLLEWLPSETRIKGIMRILYNSIHFVRKYKCRYVRSTSYGNFLN